MLSLAYFYSFFLSLYFSSEIRVNLLLGFSSLWKDFVPTEGCQTFSHSERGKMNIFSLYLQTIYNCWLDAYISTHRKPARSRSLAVSSKQMLRLFYMVIILLIFRQSLLQIIFQNLNYSHTLSLFVILIRARCCYQ